MSELRAMREERIRTVDSKRPKGRLVGRPVHWLIHEDGVIVEEARQGAIGAGAGLTQGSVLSLKVRMPHAPGERSETCDDKPIAVGVPEDAVRRICVRLRKDCGWICRERRISQASRGLEMRRACQSLGYRSALA